MSEKIHVIMQGGTIDAISYQKSQEYQKHGSPPPVVSPLKNSLVPYSLKKMGYSNECVFTQRKMQDSQLFNEADIDGLLQFINAQSESVFVVTFGTDGMAKNARRLMQRHGEIGDKTVIFTGAMEPLSHGRHSDGYQNLEFAVRVARDGKLPPGVYVAMESMEGREVFVADDKLRKTNDDIKDENGQPLPYKDYERPRTKRIFSGTIVELDLPPLPPRSVAG